MLAGTSQKTCHLGVIQSHSRGRVSTGGNTISKLRAPIRGIVRLISITIMPIIHIVNAVSAMHSRMTLSCEN